MKKKPAAAAAHKIEYTKEATFRASHHSPRTHVAGKRVCIFVGSSERQLIFCLHLKSFWFKQVRQSLCV